MRGGGGGKDEEMVTSSSPMFPRLHVNDKEKGGPRAPPRNKMALYEQLSIPSQRFSSGSTASMLPLPPPSNIGHSLVPSMSSSDGGGHERSVFTQFCNSPEPSLLAEKLHSNAFSGMKLNSMMASQDWKSMNPKNYKQLNATGPLSSLTAKSSLFKPNNLSNFRGFSLKKFGDEVDLRVPTSPQFGRTPHSSNSLHIKDRKNKQTKGCGFGSLKSRPYARNEIEDNAKVQSHASQDPSEKSASITLRRDRNLVEVSSSQPSKVKCSDTLKRAHSSLNQENRTSSVDILSSLHANNVRLHKGSVAVRDEVALSLAKDIDKENAFKMRIESCSRQPFRENSSPIRLENRIECREDKSGRSVQVKDVDRRDDTSTTASMVDSISALGISPDDVVGVIGEKQFWKARRAIINQQRVFAVQVFELHRLMKVQKLMARSPDLFVEDGLCTENPSLNVPQVKKLPSEYVLEPPRVVKAKDHSQKPDLNTECGDENAITNLLHPSVNNDNIKTPLSNYASYSGNAPAAPVPKDIKPSSWCYPPPGNQWLVSVMSPSEGLVYKPYTGPCPPTAGFVAPFYGSCGPLAGGDFLNTAFGVLPSHQQGTGILPGTSPLGQTYFPPYGMPSMNPSMSCSAVEQMSLFPGAPEKDNDHLPMAGINFIIPHQSSSNMSSKMSRVISRCVEKFQASKESEVQGSTASSPSERARGDALPLFPMEPTVQASDQNMQTNEQPTRVIKVVPHNSKLASESAARIFQSIQEERKQYD